MEVEWTGGPAAVHHIALSKSLRTAHLCWHTKNDDIFIQKFCTQKLSLFRGWRLPKTQWILYLLKWIGPWYSWFSFERWSPPIPIDCIWTSGCQTNFVQTGSTFGYTLITSGSRNTRNWRPPIRTFRLNSIFKFWITQPIRELGQSEIRIFWKSAWENSLVGVSLSRPTRFENDEFEPSRANASIFGTSGSPRLLWDTDRSKILEISIRNVEISKNFNVSNRNF